jgi:hypothetical protein
MSKQDNSYQPPLLISLNEAVKLTGLGRDTLKELGDNPENNIMIWVKSHRKFKRQQLIEFIEKNRYID